MNIDTFRQGMSVVNNYCFLNHAANGPLHENVISELHTIADIQANGNVDVPFDHLDDGFATVRKPIAQLLNCQVDEVALTTTTAHGIGLVLESINWNSADEKGIIIDDLEFTSNSFAYQQIQKKFGVNLHIVRNKDGNLDLSDFETILENNPVNLIGLSHVQFTNGFKTDLEKIYSIARKNGALLLLDAIQSCGALQLEAHQADFIAVGAYKWCLGPFATGFLYLRKNLQKDLDPVLVSASSDEKIYDFVHHEFHPHTDARKFQSVINWDYLALGKAIELLNNVGIASINEKNMKLTDYLVERLNSVTGIKIDSNRDFEHKSSIVRIIPTKPSLDLEDIMKKLQEKYKIVVSFRNNGLRVSPHFYNSFEEIDKFITVFKSLLE